MKSYWLIVEKAITEKKIDAIKKRLDKLSLKQAVVTNGQPHDTRNSDIAWVENDEEIQDIVWKYVVDANSQYFGFDIVKKYDIQYTQYRGESNQFYGWHIDSNLCSDKMYDRKLSFVMMLSNSNEYEGGDFKFKLPDETIINCEQMKTKGSIAIFPSFLSHCVTPVTSGKRKTLVSWVEGLHFR